MPLVSQNRSKYTNVTTLTSGWTSNAWITSSRKSYMSHLFGIRRTAIELKGWLGLFRDSETCADDSFDINGEHMLDKGVPKSLFSLQGNPSPHASRGRTCFSNISLQTGSKKMAQAARHSTDPVWGRGFPTDSMTLFCSAVARHLMRLSTSALADGISMDFANLARGGSTGGSCRYPPNGVGIVNESESLKALALTGKSGCGDSVSLSPQSAPRPL
mmetsp:Transcript_12484/g.29737  ORF Transcript_12484/g.29737 Transcript_12484/m.29737 type:complete len:216 (-) Transcript_12484:898-1545(-)